jgi:PAS domain S-box-containing protein
MKLFRHRKAALLAVLTIIISFSITAISTLTIYNNVQEQVYERLQNIVNREKAGIEVLINKLGVNEYDITKYLEQVRNKTNSIGENGDIILAHMVNDSIQFLISDKLSSKHLAISKSIPFDAPMQKALNRKRGYMKVIDYNGIEVFSAFTFVEKLNCGIVAKIPTSEINKPFVKVIIWIGISVLFFIYLYLRIANWLIDNAVIKEKKLAIANNELAFQNEEKEKQADELAAIKVELEQQNSCLNKTAIVSETDADFNITFVNENFCELYGYQREELIGQNHRILKSGKQPDVFFTDMISTINSGKVFKAKILNKQKGGGHHWMDITIMPFKDLTGKIIKHVAIMFDINSQTVQKEILLKQTEELAIANTELAFQNNEKEKRAEELAIANTELAFQNNEKEKRAEELAIANTELAFQNNEKEKRAEELAIANTELAFQNKEKDNRAEELILANKEKQKRAEELVLAKKEKEKRASELILANKELAYQTALDGYRSEMERVALDLTVLIDTANAPIFGIDSRGLVNEWNQTSEKITGFTKDEVLRKDLVQTYITEDYRESVKKVLDDALLGKETANYKFPLFTKDNRRVTVLLNSTTRRDADGKIVGVIGVGQDISEINAYNEELIFQNEEKEKREVELILANKELKKTNSELDRFVYSASHDLRSPLKSMLGLSNMIIDDISPDNRNQLEQMGMMRSSIIKLDNFIEDILDYSRNARKEVAMKAIDFNQTIGDIMNNLGHMDGADTIELKLEINQKMEFISDRARVNMIFNNLISNAIKYKDNSKENAFIAINVDCSNDFATISIEDNGIGIDEKNLGRIFDMFYRATKLSTGSGLGLYIAKEAIEKINGTMKIESELTHGTKFSITIPNQLVIFNK